MKSIMITYPNFRALPKGVKQMLLASETFFFDQLNAASKRAKEMAQSKLTVRARVERWNTGRILHPSWKN